MNKEHVLRGAPALFTHRAFMRAALATAQAFAWVIAFQYFFSLSLTFAGAMLGVITVYILSQVVTVVLTPLSGARLRRGFRPLMAYGVLAVAGAFMAFGIGAERLYPDFSVFEGILLFSILFGAYRALYWIPYGIGSSAHEQVRPFTRFATDILIAALPLVAGVMLLMRFGMITVFLAAGVLALLSLPLLGGIRDRKERYAWSYTETFKALFNGRYQGLVLNSIVSGAESAALFLIWPIAVFLIVGQKYDALGAILSATLLALLVGKVLARRLSRRWSFESSPVVEASVVFSAWVMRLVAAAPIAIVAVDTYYHLGAPRRFEGPYAVGGYEQAGDGGTYVDELTALKEIGLAAGRIGLCAITLCLLPLGSPALILAVPILVAALAAAVSVMLARTMSPSAY